MARHTITDYDPTDISRLVATVDDVTRVGAPHGEGQWYVARTAPQREIKVAMGLAEIGVTPYCPYITRYRGRGEQRRKVKTPLMIGYLFLFLPSGRGWWDVRLIDGLKSILTDAMGAPAAIAVADVLRLRRKERDGRYDYTIDHKAARQEVETLRANLGDLQDLGAAGVAAVCSALWPEPEPYDEAA